MICEHCLL